MAIRTPSPILLAEPDPSWVQEQAQTRSCLLDAARGRLRAVEPIGSTAVEGLVAEPVIDVLALLDAGGAEDDAELLRETILRIEGIAYRDLGPLEDFDEEPGGPPRLLVKPRGGVPTHRVLLARPGDAFALRSVEFRDWLRRNPTDAARYADLKRHLVALFPEDREAYRRGKAGFFRHVARLWREAAAAF